MQQKESKTIVPLKPEIDLSTVKNPPLPTETNLQVVERLLAERPEDGPMEIWLRVQHWEKQARLHSNLQVLLAVKQWRRKQRDMRTERSQFDDELF